MGHPATRLYEREFHRRGDAAMRPAADVARSSHILAALPHCVFFITQYQREYMTWKPHSHSKAIEMNA
jgi:hypothetical protein